MLLNLVSKKILSKYLTNKTEKTFSEGKYLYKFGGLTLQNYAEYEKISFATKMLLMQLFNAQIQDNFKIAYKAFLDGLLSKDKLASNVDYKDVKLQNSDAPIDVQYGNLAIVFGAGFDRSKHLSEWILATQGKEGFQVYRTLYPLDQQTKKIPFLFSIQIYFKSKLKLIQVVEDLQQNQKIKTQQDVKNNQQIHMLQFQTENLTTVPQIFKNYLLTRFKYFFNKKQRQWELARRFIGTNKCDWKIADSDKILNGNFPNLKKQV